MTTTVRSDTAPVTATLCRRQIWSFLSPLLPSVPPCGAGDALAAARRPMMVADGALHAWAADTARRRRPLVARCRSQQRPFTPASPHRRRSPDHSLRTYGSYYENLYCLRQGGYVIVVVCLFVSNFAQKLPNGFAWNFQGRLAMSQWTYD